MVREHIVYFAGAVVMAIALTMSSQPQSDPDSATKPSVPAQSAKRAESDRPSEEAHAANSRGEAGVDALLNAAKRLGPFETRQSSHHSPSDEP